ncbi:MAG: M56 family metallopeptidase, partial [Pirellulales bacterium]|nr:M56 family metallopeptidase [Pirellulales bacterium]
VAGLILLRLSRKAMRLRRLLGHTDPARPAVLAMARRALEDSGLGSIPEIRVSSSIQVPFATGLFRPLVVLPAEVAATADAAELRLILTHEFGHIAGQDLRWGTLAWMARGLLWFHPLVWRLPSAHQIACETVCDALATPNDASRQAYRRLLAKLALLVNGRPAVNCDVAMPATAEVTRRLRRLTRPIPCENLSRRCRVLAGGVGLMGVAAVAAATLVPRVQAFEPVAAAPPSMTATPPAPPQERLEKPEKAEGPVEDSTWTIRLRAVDADTHQPIANPRFLVQLGNKKTWYNGDEKGEFFAELPSRVPRYCYLKVRANRYTPMRGFWANRSSKTPDELPEQLTFRMTRGITVGGVVVNEKQQPVAGATVLFSAGSRQPEQRIEQSFYQEKYVTDEQGRWQCPIAPREMNSGSINVNHPDYARVTSSWSVRQAIDQLKAQQYQWTLKDSFVIRGTVTDPDGAPVEGAHLAVGTLNNYDPDGPFAVTDAQGRYEFRRIGSSSPADDPSRIFQMTVTVLRVGLAPQMAVVPGTGQRALGTSNWEQRTLDFQLDKGKPLTIRVTDADGKPVEKVWIFPSAWRDDTTGLTVLRKHGIPEYSDSNGVWQWETAPAEEVIEYDILGRGFMDIRDKKLVAGQEYAIKLMRPQVLTGQVTDADTGEPIDEFVIQKGFEGMSGPEYPDGVWWTSNSQGRKGRYRRVVSLPKESYRWRFVAEGYEPFDSDSIPVFEGELIMDVKLKKKAAPPPTQK